MTKKQKAREEAVQILKEWGVVDGSTINAKVNKVSASGMSRNVALYIVIDGEIKDISFWAAKALEWNYSNKYNGGIRVTGCGMDMLFATIDALSYAMGYGAICQDRDRVEPVEKGMVLAIGLKYKQI